MSGVEPGMSDREADALLYILSGLAEMEQPADDESVSGSPEWHSLHHTGEGQHHECDYDVCVEWSMGQVRKAGVR